MFIVLFASSFISIGAEKPHWGSGQLRFFFIIVDSAFGAISYDHRNVKFIDILWKVLGNYAEFSSHIMAQKSSLRQQIMRFLFSLFNLLFIRSWLSTTQFWLSKTLLEHKGMIKASEINHLLPHFKLLKLEMPNLANLILIWLTICIINFISIFTGRCDLFLSCEEALSDLIYPWGCLFQVKWK